MNETVYKFLNGREATHVPGFRYRLGAWQPAIKDELVPCRNAYHGVQAGDLSRWIARDLFVIESKDEWFKSANKLYTRGPVRIIEHLKGWNKRTARLCAADFVERVLPLFEREFPNDDSPRLAIQAARDYANGQTNASASAAAAAAAYAAYDTAAAAAAYAAAYAAYDTAADTDADTDAYAAAYAAAFASASAAASVAPAAGYVREREWQGGCILDYAYGRAG